MKRRESFVDNLVVLLAGSFINLSMIHDRYATEHMPRKLFCPANFPEVLHFCGVPNHKTIKREVCCYRIRQKRMMGSVRSPNLVRRYLTNIFMQPVLNGSRIV
jgi:hypothetical protein